MSHTTASAWISVLQALFVVHLLPSHHRNFSKRVIKSPKLYFLDSGLLCNLLRIQDPAQIAGHANAIFETFVVGEYLKAFTHRGIRSPLYFWRDRTGHEIDLVIDDGTRLLPVEMKAGLTRQRQLVLRSRRSRARHGVLVYGGRGCRGTRASECGGAENARPVRSRRRGVFGGLATCEHARERYGVDP